MGAANEGPDLDLQPMSTWQRAGEFLRRAVWLVPVGVIGAGFAGSLVGVILSAFLVDPDSLGPGLPLIGTVMGAAWAGAFIGAVLALARALGAGDRPVWSAETAKRVVVISSILAAVAFSWWTSLFFWPY